MGSTMTDSTMPEPEALFIAALIQSGDYNPHYYGVTDDYFSAERNVHKYCVEYQNEAERAPTLELVKKRFPTFPYIDNINPKWAAKVLYEKWAQKTLSSKIKTAIDSLVPADGEPCITDVIEQLTNAVKTVQPRAVKPKSINDYDLFSTDTVEDVCPVIQGKLAAITGGIRGGDLWYVAARLGEGKSWRLIQHAVAAAEGGWDVAFFSLEMPAKQVIDRLHRVILKDWKNSWYDLTPKNRMELIEEWQSRGRGRISVFDPSSGRCDAAVVAGTTGPSTLAVIDYVGLMYTTSGSRSIDDWRAAATVSNQLKETAIANNVPIISAAQINRLGEGRTDGVPKTSNLAQTDALGQDADLVLTMRRHSTRVLANGIVKFRHGQSGAKWYTRFEPHKALLDEISHEKADELKRLDEEREAM